ncbi:MAG: undecaprenyldiphospho-muramoylpentapeptide beta-N-acetylglucosaminyltransferase [Peptococcaceae bacterium]|nr:undecaprenyldiphospho-muramoylpentapeptide beta-N-acetylglucosaminyltransferase [Peptococcaceae bacterium]
MRVVLTGGGTGGHIYPAIAIGRDLQRRVPGVEIIYIGTDKGLEADIVPKEGFAFRTVEVESLPRTLSVQTVRTGYKLVRGLVGARGILRDFKPDIVIGTGGYVCGPVVFAAARMGIATVIHEQNALPGITNKLLARSARAVLLTFPESRQYFPERANVEVTGLPIRPGILAVKREAGIAALGLDPNKFTLFATGGSRGAKSINLAMADVIAHLIDRSDIQVVLATGTATYNDFLRILAQKKIDLHAHQNILVKPYIYEMGEALAAADLCVCRAGAAFMAELLAKGKPSILVPYPFAAENHQEHNAAAVVKHGGAAMILDKELTGARLTTEVDGFLANPQLLQTMAQAALAMGKPQALEQITNVIMRISGIGA